MKKICIISANCQGAYIKALLQASEEFVSDYDIYYFVNYKREVVPEELLGKCDLLIYHPLGKNWGHLSSEYLLSRIPPRCRTLSISYLTFPIYWVFYTQDPRNRPTEKFPFGPFPYGDEFILKKIEMGYDTQKIIEEYLNPEKIFGFKDLQQVINKYIVQQKEIETRKDQKLLDFIINNYKEVKLFESYNVNIR